MTGLALTLGLAPIGTAAPEPPAKPSCALVAQLHAAHLESLAVSIGDKLVDAGSCAPLTAARNRAAQAATLVETAPRPTRLAEAAGLYRRAAVADRANSAAVAGVVTTSRPTDSCALGSWLTANGFIRAANRAWPGQGLCGEERSTARRLRDRALTAIGRAAEAPPGSQTQIDSLVTSTEFDATLGGVATLNTIVAAMPTPSPGVSLWTTWRDRVVSAWGWIADTLLPILAAVVAAFLIVSAPLKIPPVADWLGKRKAPILKWFRPRLLLSAAGDGDAELVEVVNGHVELLGGPRPRLPLEMRSATGDEQILKAFADAVAELPKFGKLAAIVTPVLRFLHPGIVVRGTVRRLVVQGNACEGVALTLTRYCRGGHTQALYAHDYDPCKRLEDTDDPPSAHLRQGALGAAAAVWLAYHFAELTDTEERMQTALGTSEWRSAARQRAGLEWYQDGEKDQATRLFAAALELDPGNRYARLNLGAALTGSNNEREAARGHLATALLLTEAEKTADSRPAPPPYPWIVSAEANDDDENAALLRPALLSIAVADANEIANLRASKENLDRIPPLIQDAREHLDKLDTLVKKAIRVVDTDDVYYATMASFRSCSHAVRAYIEAEDGRGDAGRQSATEVAWRHIDAAVRTGDDDHKAPQHRPGKGGKRPWAERVATLPVDGRTHYNLACSLTLLAQIGPHDDREETHEMAKAHLDEAVRSARRMKTAGTDPALTGLRDADPKWFGSLLAHAPDYSKSELASLPCLRSDQAAALAMYDITSQRDLVRFLAGHTNGSVPAAFAKEIRGACADARWLLQRMSVGHIRILHKIGIGSRPTLARWKGRERALSRWLATVAASLKEPPPGEAAVIGWVEDAAGADTQIAITRIEVEHEVL